MIFNIKELKEIRKQMSLINKDLDERIVKQAAAGHMSVVREFTRTQRKLQSIIDKTNIIIEEIR